MKLVNGEWLDFSKDSKNKQHSSELKMQIFYRTLYSSKTYSFEGYYTNEYGSNSTKKLFQEVVDDFGGELTEPQSR